MIMEIRKRVKRYSYRLYYRLSRRPARIYYLRGGDFSSVEARNEVLSHSLELIQKVSCEVVQIRLIESICYVSADK